MYVFTRAWAAKLRYCPDSLLPAIVALIGRCKRTSERRVKRKATETGAIKSVDFYVAAFRKIPSPRRELVGGKKPSVQEVINVLDEKLRRHVGLLTTDHVPLPREASLGEVLSQGNVGGARMTSCPPNLTLAAALPW